MTASTPPDGEALRERVRRALTSVRREALKAAALHAFVYATLATLLVNLGLTVLGAGFPGPDYTRLALAVGVGLVVLAGTFAIRTRVPLIEQFEAVNPNVAEALRTARDTVAEGTDTTVARRLYADVLAGLREASSADLVDTARVGLAVVLVIGVSLATVQVSAVGIELLGDEPESGSPDLPDQREREYDGLQDGDAILGAETDVDSGDNDLDAVIGGSTGGTEAANATDQRVQSGGFSSAGSFEAQQAAFAGSDDVENADIIREYNLRIRDDDND